MKLLEERYGSSQENAEDLEKEDREDLLAALLELRGHFRKLQWYGEVNRRGFVKITKKLDKKIEGSHTQKKYLSLKVDPCAFAQNTQLFQALERINKWMSLLIAASEAAKCDEGAKKPIIPSRLHKSSSQQALRIPDANWSLLERHIKEDDATHTQEVLMQTKQQFPGISEHQFQQFLKGLLQRAVHARSRKCVSLLLGEIVFLDDSEDINRRNCIHRLVISIGRAHDHADKSVNGTVVDAEAELYSFIKPASSPSNIFKQNVQKDDKRSTTLGKADEPIDFLEFLLDNLSSDQRSALGARDNGGRTPLHFAAEYGVRVMVQVIVEHLQSWGMFNIADDIDGAFWQDSDGWAPLHLSVIGGHPLTTQALLDAEAEYGEQLDTSQVRKNSSRSSAVLAIATKNNFVEVVRTLVKARVDINFQDEHGETALHIAARFGHVECAQILLMGSTVQTINTEIREKTYGWTPLFVASVDGHLPIVDLFIRAGADVDLLDWSGWSAKEHAALRGHLDVAMRLAEVTTGSALGTDANSGIASTSPPNPLALRERRSNAILASNQNFKVGETIKEFGHRYLKDKSMILVSLGTMDMRKPAQAVSLDHIPMTNASSTQLDSALSIVISAKGAEGEPEIIDLPVHDNIATEPITFFATDLANVKVLFDLVPTYAGSHERIVGRGVALLSSIKASLGVKRMPLQGDVSVPIIAAGDLEVIGSVTFNFLVITPFQHPKMAVSNDHTYWKKVAQTMLIGHRGLGKNFGSERRSLQLGENTVESFIAAANLGATYVEFDVQLTKDHVPVIYHDFLVSETGIDAPVHTLTLNQFLHVNESRTPRQSRPPSPSIQNAVRNVKASEQNARIRSMSVGAGHNNLVDMEERMKYTRDFQKHGFKGNSRGNHVQSSFATLEDLFKRIPLQTGFNIEMKYPMLSESQDEEMDWYAVELNSFVDTVLTKVYDFGEGRNIMFSSFNPDICLLLSFKQPSIPVLFLTDSGNFPVGDVRASSLQEAIRFAARWNLLGIVSACEPFVIAPRLVKVVKESGLVCMSYGTMNNEPENVRLQKDYGIDAVIVDSILQIRNGLREHDEQASKTLADGKPISGDARQDVSRRAENTPLTLADDGCSGSSVATLSISGGDDNSEPSLTESPTLSTFGSMSEVPRRKTNAWRADSTMPKLPR